MVMPTGLHLFSVKLLPVAQKKLYLEFVGAWISFMNLLEISVASFGQLACPCCCQRFGPKSLVASRAARCNAGVKFSRSRDSQPLVENRLDDWSPLSAWVLAHWYLRHSADQNSLSASLFSFRVKNMLSWIFT